MREYKCECGSQWNSSDDMNFTSCKDCQSNNIICKIKESMENPINIDIQLTFDEPETKIIIEEPTGLTTENSELQVQSIEKTVTKPKGKAKK